MRAAEANATETQRRRGNSAEPFGISTTQNVPSAEELETHHKAAWVYRTDRALEGDSEAFAALLNLSLLKIPKAKEILEFLRHSEF